MHHGKEIPQPYTLVGMVAVAAGTEPSKHFLSLSPFPIHNSLMKRGHWLTTEDPDCLNIICKVMSSQWQVQDSNPVCCQAWAFSAMTQPLLHQKLGRPKLWSCLWETAFMEGITGYWGHSSGVVFLPNINFIGTITMSSLSPAKSLASKTVPGN